MDKNSEFSEGDFVRVKQGAFASFEGHVIRVDSESERMTVQGRFEGQSDSDMHILNLNISVVEKIEGGTNSRGQVLQTKALDLNAVVSDLRTILGRLIGADIELRTVLDPALGRVTADPEQIEQVVMNLVVNARDAMPRGGKLTIETANVDLDEDDAARNIAVKPGLYVMLAVTDTGTGMDEETQARIFEPLFTTKEAGKNTGLGLSTVYEIVHQSGGNIRIYSEAGRGATFKVYLPRL